jgi:hypothetical protein
MMKHLPHSSSTGPIFGFEDYFIVFFHLCGHMSLLLDSSLLVLAALSLRGRDDDILPVSLSTACSALQIL